MNYKGWVGRYGPVAILAAIAGGAVWYINVEDSNVGHEYARIFHQNPSLIPANLTSLAALHIQTAALVAQMCVTIGLAIAFSRAPTRPAEPTDELAAAMRSLAEAVTALATHVTPSNQQRDGSPGNRDRPGTSIALDLTEKGSPDEIDLAERPRSEHRS